MTRGDIIGGMRIALFRGQKLQEVMQSFYNAGYKKEEIEEAARILKSEGFQPQIAKTPLQPLSTPISTEKKETHPSYVPPPKDFSIPPKQTQEQQTPVAQPQIQKPFPPTQTLKPVVQTQTQTQIQIKSQTSPQPIVQKQEPPKPPVLPPPPTIGSGQAVYEPAPRQFVSFYGQEEKPKSKIDFVTILLIGILVLLVGVLVAVFFFKLDIMQFLNKIMGE